jgi:DNA uptake protein ComE-like DNA-binding protein
MRFLLLLERRSDHKMLNLLLRNLSTPTADALSARIFGDKNSEYTGVFLLDPNTAPVDSLELLPGIGRVLADRIVEYRQTHRFEHPVDLTEVKGIKPKLFEALKPYLRINQP